jgi:Uma2 family endonuclease
MLADWTQGVVRAELRVEEGDLGYDYGRESSTAAATRARLLAEQPRHDQDPEWMSVEEYLALTDQRGLRCEYVGGRTYGLNPETPRHSLITANLTSLLKTHLRGSHYGLFNAGVRLHFTVEQEPVFYCPDLMVVPAPYDVNAQYLTNPLLIIEVLSASTDRVDWREKAHSYRYVSSLQEYVLIAQHAPRVAVHRRAENWRPSFLSSLDTTAEFRSIELILPLGRIYEGVLT